MLYNIDLISVIHQQGLTIGIHMSPPSKISLPPPADSLLSRLLQSPSLSWEDPLEKGMATHSSILAWRIPWTEEPGGLQSMGSLKSRT